MTKSLILRRLLNAIFFLLLTFPQVFSQTSGPKTVFWKIYGNGLEKPSYLFGTIHIMPKEDFESFRVVDKKLKESEQMVLEMAIDVPLKQQIEWAKQMILPKGQTLDKFMTTTGFDSLRHYVLDSLGVKESRFNTYLRFKPFAFYSALIPAVIGKKIEGYELYFSKIAKKKNIPVRELESFEFQMGLFDSIPNDKQMRMFFSGGQDLRNDLNETLVTYKEQDIYKMSQDISTQDTSSDFESQLIEKRNKAWIPKLVKFITEKPSFIAVGAGHLAGEHGLILQLRELGYDVEPVMLRDEN